MITTENLKESQLISKVDHDELEGHAPSLDPGG
jgi:hypothetical protein